MTFLPGLAGAALREGERVARRGRIREVVFGAQDGLLSTLALVTGVVGADVARETTLIAGLSGALAGTVSMALGAYVAAKSQRDVFAAELAEEKRQIARRPHVETIELMDILMSEGLEYDAARKAAQAIATSEQAMLKTMAEKELGIRFEPPGSPIGDAATMGVSFAVGAAVPILPYVVLSPGAGLPLSVGLTLAARFGMGTVQARLSREHWLRSGLEIVVLAGTAAVLAYLAGQVLPARVGVAPTSAG